MTMSCTKLAILFVSLTTILGVCCRVYDGTWAASRTTCGSTCSLQPRELAERKKTLEASLGLKTLERREIEDGVAVRFPNDPQTVREVFDFVAFERGCCGRSVTFEVILSQGVGPFWVRFRGDERAKALLMNMFDVPGNSTDTDSSTG